MQGKSRSERTASVSRAERDGVIDQVRNITSRMEHAKKSARTKDEAEVEEPFNRDILYQLLAGILGVLTGVLLLAAGAAVLR